MAKNMAFSRPQLQAAHFSVVCRVCLSDSKVLTPIEEISFTHCLNPTGAEENISLAAVFLKFCKVEITSSDGKPLKICEQCLDLSCKAFNFFQLFLWANQLIEAKLKGPPKQSRGMAKFDKNMLELKESWLAENVHSEEALAIEDDIDIKEEPVSCSDSETEPNNKQINLPSSSSIEYFKCQICNIEFKHITKLVEHAKDDHAEESSCLICSKPCDHWEYYYHLATHSSNALVCTQCNLYFESPEELDAHTTTIDHSKPTCYICLRQFSGRDTLARMRRHIKQVHFKQEKHQCPTCEKVFLYPDNLKRHILASHMNQRKYLCQYCANSYTTNYMLRRHMQKGHGVESGIDLEKYREYHKARSRYTIGCQYCELTFKTTHDFYSHSALHPEFEGYECEICHLQFESLEALREHQTDHTQHECTECGERFVLRTHLTLHKRKHLDKSLLPVQMFKCEFCQKIYNREHAFYQHLAAHPEFKDFRCKVCEEVFDKYHKLEAHMTGHKKYKCPKCPMKFVSKVALGAHKYKHKFSASTCNVCGLVIVTGTPGLIKHMTIHTGKRSHLCEVCGKGFKQKPHLIMHMHQHGLQKPWQCKLCDKSFEHGAILKRHMRSHTGEKPYTCLYCEKVFRDSTIRHKHIKKFHSEHSEEYEDYRKKHLREEIRHVESVLDQS